MELFILERESFLFVLFLKLELLLLPPLSISVENSVKLFSLSPSDDFRLLWKFGLTFGRVFMSPIENKLGLFL